MEIPNSTGHRAIQNVWNRNKWNALKALPLGVLLPLLMTAATTGPEDIGRNLAKWASAIGLVTAGDWLLIHATAPKIIWGTAATVVSYVGIVWGVTFLIDNLKKKTQRVAVPASVAVILILGISATAYLTRDDRPQSIEHLYDVGKLEDTLRRSTDPRFPIHVMSSQNVRSQTFARQIAETFRNNGYSAEEFAGVVKDQRSVGLFVLVSTKANLEVLPNKAAALLKILSSAGYDGAPVQADNPDGPLDDNFAWLYVGLPAK